MIQVFCQQNRLKEAVDFLHRIPQPSPRLYSTLIVACLRHQKLEFGKRVHAHAKASNFIPDIVISNCLIHMYAKCGSLVYAHMVFDEMPQKDLCSWNTMISGYANVEMIEQDRKLFDEMPHRDNFLWNSVIPGYVSQGRFREALDLFRLMQENESSNCNMSTLPSSLVVAAAIPSLRCGKEIHWYLIRSRLELDEVVKTALLDLNGKCGSLNEVRGIFYQMADKDVVSWTTMTHRCFEDGRKKEGFSLFRDLSGLGVRPNEHTFAAEGMGKEVHGYMTRLRYDLCSFVVSALVHEYLKCGNTKTARRVFNQMPRPDLVSWTSLIVGHAH